MHIGTYVCAHFKGPPRPLFPLACQPQCDKKEPRVISQFAFNIKTNDEHPDGLVVQNTCFRKHNRNWFIKLPPLKKNN